MTLIKGASVPNYDTVVFVGNGAIKNGFNPLRNAIDAWIANDPSPALVKKLRSNNSEAFHQLAILSYKFKMNRGILFSKHLKNPNVCVEADIENYINQSIMQGFLNFRSSIANEFCRSTELELRLDDKIKEVIGPNPIYVTTNWDNVLWDLPEIENLIHLHGKCDWAESIVFPTELLVEDTAYELAPHIKAIQKFKQQNQDVLYSIYRYGAMADLIDALMAVSDKLKHAKRLVIWGYSLGDYDADINAMIGTWNQGTETNELWVINPDTNVLKRSIALTGCMNAKLYDPVTTLIHSISDK